MDYGAHTAYILTAYAVSILALTGLIVWRVLALKKATAAEEARAKETL